MTRFFVLIVVARGRMWSHGRCGQGPAISHPWRAVISITRCIPTRLPRAPIRRGRPMPLPFGHRAPLRLFGDRRAGRRGDILTVVIEIDDKAEMSNSSGRKRNGSETMGVPSLFGIPERLNEELPDGASMAEAVKTNSSSSLLG